MVEYSILLKYKKIRLILIIKQASPTLLTIKAFIAALFANTLVFQKPINKYEHIPTPSQPRNSRTRLSALTKTNIKKLKSERYAKNFVL